MKNPYQAFEAKVEDIIVESPTIKSFRIRPKVPVEFKTGQFVELMVPGLGEAPFTPSSSPAVKEEMEITIMKVGKITDELHAMKPGATVGLRGPFGKGYPLDDFEGKTILIVGGGVGLAPLRSLILALFHRIDNFEKIVLCFGARTPADYIYKKQIPDWGKNKKVILRQTVDHGTPEWKGQVGVVTVTLDNLPLEIKNTVAVVCGPPIMMKFATMKLLELGFNPKGIYLSMEKNMSCGFGKCGHCRIGPYHVCQDGPVFTYDQLKPVIEEVWD